MDRPRQRYGSDDRPLQSGAIDIDHLSFAYRDDNLVYRILRYQYRPVALWRWWGTPAAGRARCQLINGVLPLTQGEIRLDGREILS